MTDEILMTVTAVVADYLNVPVSSVTTNTKLPERRLDRIELGMLVADTLDLRLPRGRFPELATVGDLASLVRSVSE